MFHVLVSIQMERDVESNVSRKKDIEAGNPCQEKFTPSSLGKANGDEKMSCILSYNFVT